MIKILITGADSYLGTSFEQYMQAWPDKYHIDTVDMRDGTWRQKDFSGYDTVYHVAGVAHTDKGKMSAERTELHYRINTTLAVETAEKAKREGVRRFIFLSSMAVYGPGAPVGGMRVITRDTPLTPDTAYGDSKKRAEEALLPMNCDSFKVVIVRPPMIYGRGCKGNYTALSKLARKLPVFPKVNNARSMLYVDHLSAFIRLMIDNGESGIFCPQNKEYSNTGELVRLIAQAHGRKILLVPGFTWALKLMGLAVGQINKAFGSITYAPDLSAYKQEYCAYGLEETIIMTEKEG